MTSPILPNCPFCGAAIQHFIGHVSGHYAYYCTHSKKMIVLYEALHEKITETGLDANIKKRVKEYILSSDEFEIHLTLQKVRSFESEFSLK